MKIALASDLHLEFGSITLKNQAQAQVLILSGDIYPDYALDTNGSTSYASRYDNSADTHRFFKQVCSEFENVVYVLGNHEHYAGDFPKTAESLKNKLGYLPNLHILNNEVINIGSVTFFGGTLWTDMNKEDPETLLSVRSYLNDFRQIQDSRTQVLFKDNTGTSRYRPANLTPEATVIEHKAFLNSLAAVYAEKLVVVSHHAPHPRSIHPKYKSQTKLNGAYSSDLTSVMESRPEIVLWTHGHTHHPFDYYVSNTRVLCNPRGYHGYEPQASNYQLQYLGV